MSENYLPVSNLPLQSTVVERVLPKQVTLYLSEANLFPPFLSAYRLRHSNETAVLKIFSDGIGALDAGNITLLALLDLTAAFDTVDNNILLERLPSSIGFDKTVRRWFDAYVTGRNQAVHLSDTTALPSPLVCSASQGSIWVHFFLLLYTADISSLLQLMDCFIIATPLMLRSTFVVVHQNDKL